MGSENERLLVEEAVRGFFERSGRRDKLELATGLAKKAGELAQLATLGDVMDVAVHPDVGSVDVVRIDEDAAEVVVSAGASVVERWVDGKRLSWHVSWSGPVKLRREGTWKVADYCIDGHPLSETLVIGRLWNFTQEDIGLAILGVMVHPREAALWVELRAPAAADVSLQVAKLVRFWGRQVIETGQSNPLRAPAGATRVGRVGFHKGLPRRARRIRGVLWVESPDLLWKAPFRFSIAIPSLRRRRASADRAGRRHKS